MQQRTERDAERNAGGISIPTLAGQSVNQLVDPVPPSYKEQEYAHPGQPCTTVRPKCQVPCWLQGLEIFIGLEKGSPRADGVYKTEGDKTHENVSRSKGQPMLRVKLLSFMGRHSQEASSFMSKRRRVDQAYPILTALHGTFASCRRSRFRFANLS